jgi:hypothetical protein
MAIARMFVRSGLLTLALMSAVATAKAICRVTRLPSPSEAKPERTRSHRVRQSIRAEIQSPVPSAAIRQLSSSVKQRGAERCFSPCCKPAA